MTELSVEGTAVDLTELPSHQPMVRFGAFSRTIEGVGGCNEFSGSFTYVEGTMAPADVYFTIVGCSLPIETEVDAALQRLWSGPVDITGNDKTLELSGSGVTATLVRLED